MSEHSTTLVVAIALAVCVAFGGGLVVGGIVDLGDDDRGPAPDAASGDETAPSDDLVGASDPAPTSQELLNRSASDVGTFASESAYREHVQRGGTASAPVVWSGSIGLSVQDVQFSTTAETDDVVEDAASYDGGADGGDATEPRQSGTNVQIQGIDEPDLVKTDGEWLYYADPSRSVGGETHRTQVLDARDLAAPTRSGAIPAGGQLLRAGDTLVAIENDAVYGFDVSDPDSPEERWHRPLNHSVQTARLADGRIYLVLRDRPSVQGPCPIEPLAGDDVTISCTDVYRPAGDDGGDTTYTALSLDPETGDVGDEVSFVGNGDNTVVYVSEEAIYLSYEDSPPESDLRLAYLRGPGSEHLDQQALDRLDEIASYDLSPHAMQTEIDATIQRRIERLPEDERDEVGETLYEEYQAYVDEHKRDLVRTGIVRIGIDGPDLAVEETGAVPGRVDGQFAFTEREGHLHVATTVNHWQSEWENDLYTLDDDLEVVDEVTGMGTEMRIYSVRYVGDRAYLVTFRQVDPLHVVDVSDPTDLELQGVLELPGYSDYLHPIGEDRLLGIGEEDGRVKATLFDVSDPEDPVVADDLTFEDRWTAISRTHHAFLLDERHGVFFLPGSEGGHVVAYEDGLERVTTVDTDGPALRARYIGDHLYVFAPGEVVVVDQTEWEETERVDLA